MPNLGMSEAVHWTRLPRDNGAKWYSSGVLRVALGAASATMS
jgi:hypothetical protein